MRTRFARRNFFATESGTLLKLVLGTGFSRAWAMLSMLVLAILSARLLGPEGRGEMATALALVQILAVLGHLSLSQALLGRAWKADAKLWAGPTACNLALMTLLVGGLGFAAGGIFMASGRAIHNIGNLTLLIGLAALPFYIWEQQATYLLAALNLLGPFNRASALARTAAVLLVWLAAGILKLGPAGAVAALGIGEIFLAIATFRILPPDYRRNFRPNFDWLKQDLRAGLKLHPNAVGVAMTYNTDILILQHYTGNEAVGFYNLAMQLLQGAILVPQSAAMAINTVIAKVGPDRAWISHRRLILVVLAAVLAEIVVGWLAAPLAVRVLAGAAFAPAVPLFRVLLLALVGIGVSGLMAPQWLGRGFFLQASSLTILVGAVGIGLNLVLVPAHGASGAAVTMVAVSVLMILANLPMALYAEARRRAAAPQPVPGE